MSAANWKALLASRRTGLVCLLLAGVTLAIYWPVRRHAFINYDDPLYITENPHVQAGLTRPGLAWAFLNLHGDHTYWHPLTWVSHMLDCQWFGLDPGAHHLVNIAYHIANSLLLLLLLHRLTGAFWRSAMVAALFALHPLQVDTVAWVTERKNLLSTGFLLLTLWAYARYVEVQSPKSKVQSLEMEGRSVESKVLSLESGVHSDLSLYLLSLLFFALGLMCKPVLVTLPFVLLLLDFWPLRRLQLPRFKVQSSTLDVRSSPPASSHHSTTPLLRLLWEKLPFLALAAAAALITIAGHHEIRAEGSAGLPWQWRVGNALVSYVRYLGKTFWPSHLSVFYPHPGAWSVAAVAGSALLLLAVSGWVLWRARRAPWLLTGWFWFLGVLVPMIGLIQAGAQAMADRFAYVPLIGLFLMVVWGLTDRAAAVRQSRVPPSRDYSSAVPAKHATDAKRQAHTGRPESTAPSLINEGQRPSWWRRPPVPLASFRVFSGKPLAWLSVLGLLALAECAVLTSRQLAHWRNTTTLFEHALRVTRDNSAAHFSLGNEAADQGRFPEAMRHWEAALAIEPARPDIHGSIAAALRQQGDLPGALARYHRALEIDPNHPEVLNNLAWLLATCPDATFRDGPEAVRLARRACELTRFRRPILVGTLAAAYAAAGRFDDARETARNAIQLAEASGQQPLAERNRELLKLYKAGKPFREPGG